MKRTRLTEEKSDSLRALAASIISRKHPELVPNRRAEELANELVSAIAYQLGHFVAPEHPPHLAARESTTTLTPDERRRQFIERNG